MTKEMICIVCPMSCHISVQMNENNEIVAVSGNKCPRGDVYVRKELTNPTRMLTSTVTIQGGIYERLPVITSQDIPKSSLFEVMNAINQVSVTAPIERNQIIIPNVCGLGVDIIASRSMDCVNQDISV